MGDTWGHALTPRAETDFSDAWWDVPCSRARCTKPSTWLATYRYVTGHAGRRSTATRRLCDDHAERFHQKHLAAIGDDDG